MTNQNVSDAAVPKTKILSGAWTALILLFLVSVFNYVDRFVLGIVLPSIKDDWDLSDTALGGVGTAFTLSYVLLGIPFARLADRHSRKAIISISLAIWSAMTALCGVTQNVIQLAAARVLVGVGEAGALPPSHSIISDYFPPATRTRALAVFGIGAPVGLIIGFVFASWLVENYSWRIAFLALGIPGIVFAVACYFLIKEPPRGHSEMSQARAEEAKETPTFVDTLKTLTKSSAFIHLAIGTSLYTIVYIAIVTWLPSYFIRSFELELTQVGLWLALSVGVSQLIGMLCSGAITDALIQKSVRWYARIPAFAMFVSAPILAFVFVTENAVLATVILAPAFLISILQGPPTFAALQALTHVRMRAMAVAIFLLIVNLMGGLLGPILTGVLSDALVQQYGEDSLKWALMLITIVFGLWAGLHYALAGRTIEKEINSRQGEI